MGTTDRGLGETRRAFDALAPAYDAEVEPNPVLGWMRGQLWAELGARLPPGSRLCDLGCGSGIDAVTLAGRGYRVTALDWSPAMVATTLERARRAGVSVEGHNVGIHQLATTDPAALGAPFDALYSDLGPFNCVDPVELGRAAAACARLLAPGGWLFASVMGRLVPWEHAFYLLRGDLARARLRFRREAVPVGLAGGTAWTWYHTPQSFTRPFARAFRVETVRGLGIFQPPPYLAERFAPLAALSRPLAWLDERLGGHLPFRLAGDHFLTILRRL